MGLSYLRVRVHVDGIVQGVGFRPFIYRIAVADFLTGYVRNMGDAGVEILLEGKEEDVKNFLSQLEDQKPPRAQLYRIATKKLSGKKQYRDFTIRHSSEESKHSGSVIPPDIAICNQCLRELRDPNDLRYGYFFITCTNCGPRFTIIDKLPYDHENTTMRDFPMCGFCLKEYSDPFNRRFHAETIACPTCGPKAYLTTSTGEEINTDDPVKEAGILLSEGHVLAIKGYGGFHVATSTLKDEPLIRLRGVKHRSQKPFATMARNLESVKTFCKVSKCEVELLSSYTRPVVLLDKSEDYYLSELVSPSLHNVGVMLPYTGLHIMLFDGTDDPAFVMTSANPPNEPIIKDNEQALKTLGHTVDYFLFHNRRIANRCDDSVARVHGQNQVLLRRSRGYAPAPVMLKNNSKNRVVGLGGELNNTSCILLDNKAFLSQHIGDVENVETRDFLERATLHLIHLTNSKINAIACDLHPKFATTNLASKLAEKNKWQLFQVQHHYAHVTGLMVEHGLGELLGICCDGYGYGADGEAWGGEILHCKHGTFGFTRLAHLENQPLAGGDLATRYPLRIAAGILNKSGDVYDWLVKSGRHFPYGRDEIEILQNQLKTGKGIIESTSCGRVLDAAAAVLGYCYERTYEGEPAMKLESAATKGKDTLSLEPEIRYDVLQTTPLLREVFEARDRLSRFDLAYSVHSYMAKGLAALAAQKAKELDLKTVGFTGGVASNRIFQIILRASLSRYGIELVVHEAVPAGDGGLSFGQAVAAGFSRF